MSTGKSRPSHRRCLNATVTSAVVGAEGPHGGGRFRGALQGIGAAPGCRVINPSDAGAEAQGG